MDHLRRPAIPAWWRRNLVRAVAVALLLTAWWATRLPDRSGAEARPLAGAFTFQGTELVPVDVAGYQTQRTVEPQLAKLRTWMSGVGASIAFADLQGVGSTRDVCWVDPRTDTVSVAPAPGTPAAYPTFAVDPAPLAFSRATMAPTGCLPGDFNEDGWSDLLVYYWGRTPVLFVRDPAVPLGAAAFTRTELVTPVQRWYTDALTSADVDGDGHADLIVGNYFPDGCRLLDATAKDDPAFQMNDSMSRAFNGGTNRVLLWTGAARYRDVPGVFRTEVAHAWTLAIGAHDLNGDGLPEIYLANDFGPDRMLVNRSTPGTVRLTEVAGGTGFGTPKSKSLGHDSFKGMGVDFGDLNGDGRTDMFVSNISAERGLMETNFAWLNTGGPVAAGRTAPFRDASDRMGVARTGWGWDVKIDDFANDGTPDVVQATGFTYGNHNLWPQVAELAMANDGLLRAPGNWMQHTDGWELASTDRPVFLVRHGDHFVNIGKELGLDRQGITRSVAVGDTDGDGRLDLAIAGQWGPSYFYRNASARTGKALELRLLRPVGAAAGSAVRAGADGDAMKGVPAIGARATIVLPGGARYTAQVDGGNGHAGVRSPELHFGLGDIADGATVRVTVDWRSTGGTRQTRTFDVTAGRWSVLLG